jgi:hypothetical protein
VGYIAKDGALRAALAMNKAIENYKAAIQADPQTPMLSEELSEINTKRPRLLLKVPVPRLPGSR